MNVASSSPGIIFGVLGTGLMLATILTHSEIDVQDQPLYLNPNTIQFVAPIKPQEQTIHKINPALLDSLDNIKK